MAEDSEFVVALTTLSREEDAVELGRRLLERELIACVNIVPSVRSLYRFKGVIEDDPECILLMKTRRDRFEDLDRAVAELHPYEVPELLCLPVVDGQAAYLAWIRENVR